MKPSELLADPSKWTKGAVARDINGAIVEESDASAVCFCIAGAIYKCELSLFSDPRTSALYDIIQNDFGERSISMFNDAPERTHAEILDVLKRAGL